MKTKLLIFLPAITFLILASCARQTAPTGGPRDTIPPSLISSFPQKNQTDFHADHVELTFNEYINLENPKEQILITPDIEKNFDVVAKKRKLILTFKQPLQDSVTYLLNFQEAVRDITERNPAENLKIAFSTGTYIDSLIVKGKVMDPLLNKEMKGITVALYETDTFSIFNHRPKYISKTNEKGLYSIENLKPGNYYLYAFNDANRNLLVDSRTETYAFIPQRLDLQKNIESPDLSLIKLDSRPIKLTSARPYNTYFNIKFSKPIDRYTVTSTTNDSLYSITGTDNSSIKIYNNITQDSIPVSIHAWDTLEQQIDTTLYVKFLEKKSTPEPFEITALTWRLIKERGKLEGTLTYTKPILQINPDSIYFKIDSITTVNFTRDDFKLDHDQNRIHITKTFDKTLLDKKPKPSAGGMTRPAPHPNQPDTSALRRPDANRTKPTDPGSRPPSATDITNQLYIGPATFISIDKDSSILMMETLKPLTIEETGIIRLNIQTNQPFYIVQLLDRSFKIQRSVRNKSAISFEDLNPGDYQIRLVIDYNNDGRWSPGNIFKHEPTEPMYYYTNEKKNPIINLKANWELGPLLISH